MTVACLKLKNDLIKERQNFAWDGILSREFKSTHGQLFLWEGRFKSYCTHALKLHCMHFKHRTHDIYTKFLSRSPQKHKHIDRNGRNVYCIHQQINGFFTSHFLNFVVLELTFSYLYHLWELTLHIHINDLDCNVESFFVSVFVGSTNEPFWSFPCNHDVEQPCRLHKKFHLDRHFPNQRCAWFCDADIKSSFVWTM